MEISALSSKVVTRDATSSAKISVAGALVLLAPFQTITIITFIPTAPKPDVSRTMTPTPGFERMPLANAAARSAEIHTLPTANAT